MFTACLKTAGAVPIFDGNFITFAPVVPVALMLLTVFSLNTVFSVVKRS